MDHEQTLYQRKAGRPEEQAGRSMSVDGIVDPAFEQEMGAAWTIFSVKLKATKQEKMFPYVQTNLQLFEQMRKAGYSKDDLLMVSKVYEVAITLFTGYFQASGRPQIAHVVATSSILVSLHLPVDVVSAGLIHNCYLSGDFGDGKSDETEARRKFMIQAVGADVEKYAYGFRKLTWNRRAIPAIREKLSQYDPIQRNVVLIRVADVMEQHCGVGGFYYHRSIDVCRKFLTDHGETLAQMAQELGFPDLAAEMERITHEALSMEIPPDIRDRIVGCQSRIIAPRSFKRRLSVAIVKRLSKLFQRSPTKRGPKAVSSN